MPIPIIILPKDMLGSAPGTYIEDERHLVPTSYYRIIRTNFGPFFKKDLIVESISVSSVRTTLVFGTDYVCVDLLAPITQETGKGVYSSILILNASLPDNFAITYRALGGDENPNVISTAAASQTVSSSGQITDWADIQNKPKVFSPAAHLQDIMDIYGLESVTSELNAISTMITRDGATAALDFEMEDADVNQKIKARAKQGIALKKQYLTSVHTHLGQSNAHGISKAQVNLGNVENRAFGGINGYASPKLVKQLIFATAASLYIS
jgi:hypothetical protein